MELKQNEFQITLQGERHDVDAKVLSETINNFNNLVKEINAELKPEYPILPRVKPFEEGSFEIFFSLLADPNINASLFNVLTKDNLVYAGNIISTLADLISIKDFLGGEKPKSIETTKDNEVTIKNSKGDVKVVNQKVGDIVLNNPIINVTINNTFNTLNSDKEINGISLISDLNTKRLNIPKESFETIVKSHFTEQNQSKDIEKERIITKENFALSIIKIVFDDKNKWLFLDSDGNKVSATIKDKDFFERVKKRELYFTNGDVIICNLEIEQEYNEIAKAYENKNYTLVSVKDLKHQPSQLKIDL